MDTPSIPSKWVTLEAGSDYIAGGTRTETGRRKFSPRFLRSEIAKGRLRGARIGDKGQILTTYAWLDEYVEAQATPVLLNVRRRS